MNFPLFLVFETFDVLVCEGILQFDMWGVQPSNRWDWATLKKEIMTYGLRNRSVTSLQFHHLLCTLYLSLSLSHSFFCVLEFLLIFFDVF